MHLRRSFWDPLTNMDKEKTNEYGSDGKEEDQQDQQDGHEEGEEERLVEIENQRKLLKHTEENTGKPINPPHNMSA